MAITSEANAGPGRSQLRSQAFHASCRASSANPGSSAQRTAIQRDRTCNTGGGSCAVSDRGDIAASGGAAATDGEAGACCGGNGTDPHPASIPTIAANPKKRFMLLILLEALLALVLLVAIVWWTMFSGRKGGEPPSDDERTDER